MYSNTRYRSLSFSALRTLSSLQVCRQGRVMSQLVCAVGGRRGGLVHHRQLLRRLTLCAGLCPQTADPPDDVLVVVEVLEEHDFSERPLRADARYTWNVCHQLLARTQKAAGHTTPSLTCASVAFWNASKIFFKATTSRVFRSMAFHTTPYACGPESSAQLSMLSVRKHTHVWSTWSPGLHSLPCRASAVSHTSSGCAYQSPPRSSLLPRWWWTVSCSCVAVGCQLRPHQAKTQTRRLGQKGSGISETCSGQWCRLQRSRSFRSTYRCNNMGKVCTRVWLLNRQQDKCAGTGSYHRG